MIPAGLPNVSPAGQVHVSDVPPERESSPVALPRTGSVMPGRCRRETALRSLSHVMNDALQVSAKFEHNVTEHGLCMFADLPGRLDLLGHHSGAFCLAVHLPMNGHAICLQPRR